MKFVALLSGGKDSIHSTLLSIRCGHQLICCAHLSPPPAASSNDESYMYQTAGSEVLRMQVEECLDVPLYTRVIVGTSRDTSLVYQPDSTTATSTAASINDSDEVEDLYLLLQQVLAAHPDITAVSSGAILSTYQRTRIENVCSRLHLTSLAYLWRMGSQSNVLESILEDEQMEAVLVRVACPPGLTTRHLGMSLRMLRDGGVLDSLHEKWGMHVAGEGGEYETIVLDCGLFRFGRLVLEETEIYQDDNADDGVGILRILKCRVDKKRVCDAADGGGVLDIAASKDVVSINLQQDITARVQAATSNRIAHVKSTPLSKTALCSLRAKPNIQVMRGGLCHISEILSPTTHRASNKSEEAQCAVDEFLSILQTLHQILTSLSSVDQPQNDIIFVHLYLSQISHFAKINAHYQLYFGMHCPPSRSCVGVGSTALPGGRRVMLDCIIQLGSGEYLRNNSGSSNATCLANDNTAKNKMFVCDALKNKHHALRKTLHVQSISNWAPVCIGPYSQANVLRSSLVFLAGMIGLIPPTMALIQSTQDDDDGVQDWEVQLYQSWRNAASVLDGLEDGGGKLDDCIGGLVYFSLDALKAVCSTPGDRDSSHVSWSKLWSNAESICSKGIADNGGVIMGSVDGVASTFGLDPNLYDDEGILYGGYEDEETWREMTRAATSAVNEDASHVPLLMVCLAELPMNALAEVELVCASRRAGSCLEVWNGDVITEYLTCDNTKYANRPSDRDMLWDTGYEYPKNNDATIEEPQVQITAVSRGVGIGCACICTVIADVNTSASLGRDNVNIEAVLSKMIDSAISTATPSNQAVLFGIHNVLNVRLYHVASATSINTNDTESSVEVNVIDDGTMLRSQLHSVLATKSKQCNNMSIIKNDTSSNSTTPAHTVVPVMGMHLCTGSSNEKIGSREAFLSMQVTFVDAIRMETEMWIRYNRKYI